MEIKELIEQSHSLALEKGWWDSDRPIRETILMIIVELSEAVQKDRSDDTEGFNEEIADVFIRLADLCGWLNIDIEDEINKKHQINKTRPMLHNKKY